MKENINNTVAGKKIKFALLSLLLVVMLALTACGGNDTNNSGKQNQGAANNAATEDTANDSVSNGENENTQYPYTITDATNFEVTLNEAPESIVSIVPSETETLFAIGLGDKVVGVDEYSNYPEETASITKVGDMNTNIEAVTALNPDIVLASASMNADAITKLRDLGINVFASDPLTYDEVVAHTKQLGVLLNAQEDANKSANEMIAVKQEITDKVAGLEPRKVYLEFSPGWTIGTDVFLDDLTTIAGGINVANSQSGWFEVDAEAVITENPQVIIYPDFGEEQSSILAGIMSRPGWDVIDAVKNNEMVMVSNDPLVRVGPRLAQGLKEIAAAIHPELFQ